MSDEDILSLWTPRLTVTNGLSEFDTKVTEDSVGMLLSYVRKRSKADRPDKEVNFAWEMGIIDKICMFNKIGSERGISLSWEME